jgi:hypothetical protein
MIGEIMKALVLVLVAILMLASRVLAVEPLGGREYTAGSERREGSWIWRPTDRLETPRTNPYEECQDNE